MATLHGAVPLMQVDHVSLPIGQHLRNRPTADPHSEVEGTPAFRTRNLRPHMQPRCTTLPCPGTSTCATGLPLKQIPRVKGAPAPRAHRSCTEMQFWW